MQNTDPHADELLNLIIPLLDRGEVKDKKFPDNRGEYWARCPYHSPDRHATNFSVSVRGFRCYACGEKGSLKTLAKKLGAELPEAEPESLTLAQYSDAKHIPVDFLQKMGVVEATNKRNGLPYLVINYRDEHGRSLEPRFRFSMGSRPISKKGGKLYLYGLWRLDLAKDAGWILVVEGESDCHTAWLNGIPAIGVPGAGNWKAEWAQYLAGLDVYVWREPDIGGDTLTTAIKRSFPDGLALNAPDGVKDISSAHVHGLNVRELVETMKADARPLSDTMPQAMEQAGHLSDLAEWVREQLGKNSRRETKLIVAEAIADWMVSQGKLLVDLGQDAQKGGRAYLIADDKSLWPLEKEMPQTRLALHDAGLNGTEPTFAFVLEHLTMEAIKRGIKAKLSRWQERKANALYLSCGPTSIVRSSDAGLDVLENGTDDVWFAGDSTLPSWTPTDNIDPMTLPAFKPALETQDEVKDYTAGVQSDLLATWIAMLVAGIRPFLHLVCLGQRGGGKSTLARAVIRIILGPTVDLTTISNDKRDLETLLVGAPVVGLDNVDGAVPDWLPDLIAASATGMSVDKRELYTDLTKISRPANTTLIITTRTGLFARPDVAERCLPILTGGFDDKYRLADSELMGQIDANRDGIMSWAARMAWRLLKLSNSAPPGLPLRFQDFARCVWAYFVTQGREAEVDITLVALRSAQALTIGEADELAQAIIAHIDDLGQSVTGKAGEIVSRLTAAGAEISYIGGAKAIARRLREIRSTLALAGIDIIESVSKGRPEFTIRHNKRLWHQDDIKGRESRESRESGGIRLVSDKKEKENKQREVPGFATFAQFATGDSEPDFDALAEAPF